ncbi:MAG: ATP-binding protein [Bacteroidota bacterium]
MEPATIEELRNIYCLRDLPMEHLQWILDHGTASEHQDGDLIMKTGEAVDDLVLAIEGKCNFYMNVNGKLVYYFSFENDVQTGGAGGVLPYSRMKTSPGNNYAVGKVRLFHLHKKHFRELEILNPEFIQRLIGYMTERARHFATQKLQQEKVNALGQLAAGIAHELNNPAAAINRISAELIKRLMENYDLTERLMGDHIKPEFIRSVRQMVEEKNAVITQVVMLTAMQRLDREDEITGWLEKNNIAGGQLAETFTDTGITIDDLEKVKGSVSKEALPDVLQWLENRLSAQRILKDLDDASSRISNLVGAIKSHVHMDRTSDMQPTNIHKDIENTLTLLGHKLREKNITVRKNFCSDMREIPAYVGELNQVWTNLLDNAIYAVSKGGEINIETKCSKIDVSVKIIDSGPGIPQEIVSRIFDPFFTTKKQGEGTGIGLDTVMRIIKRHNAEIKVSSVPGRTVFAVCIPFDKKEKEKAQ